MIAEQIKEQDERKPYWIHEIIDDEESVTGFYYLPQCRCSNCGYLSSYEKPKCPHCGMIMNTEKINTHDSTMANN